MTRPAPAGRRPSFFGGGEFAGRSAPLSLAAARPPACGACGLLKGCATPAMKPAGGGAAGLLVVGDWPSAADDRDGRPFSPSGETGRLLRDELHRVGLSLDRDCWAAHALACRPRGAPPKDGVTHCRPNLLSALRDLRPAAVLMLGAAATESVVGWHWKPGGVDEERWAGRLIPSRKLDAWLAPTFGLRTVLRDRPHSAGRPWVVRTLLSGHLADLAARLKGGRPWPGGPPPLDERLVPLTDPARVYAELQRFAAAGRPVAFDYETDRLKPDEPGSRIYCCAVSDGDVSFAYPWTPETAAATSELLLSDVPKWGWNVQFEERWTIRHLGHHVRHHAFDGMVYAHALDARAPKDLEWQAFARLGIDAYSDAVAPFMPAPGAKERGTNARNNVHRIAPHLLLEYCAKDALVEHWLCRDIAREVGVEI